jgi:polyphenol oxidase
MLRAPQLQSPHAFTTRRGGVSAGLYAALNFDARAMNGVQDDPQHVQENRRRTLEALGFAADRLALLDQVHGTDVVMARPDTVQTADAQVSDAPGVVLGILSADCYPILLEDSEAGVIGAAHAGWKGTLGRVAGRTVDAMTKLGARPDQIRAAVGPGISAAQYPVGDDVAQQFAEGGLGEHVQHLNQPHLDLAGANAQVLREAGVNTIWVSGRCTTSIDFYSYRRDGGRTGRMLACIGLSAQGVRA